ncbi:MAG: transrane efflux protein [Candidatus Saccharibacteria bacterium]|nr:transrane efflux protein [Candidatus Saccharibacteria bacterium]
MKGKKLALVATIIGSGITLLDGTVVNLALPHIASDFHAGFSSLQWIVDGYALTLAALILIGGSLGDIFGRKKVYLIGLIGFGIVSLACGLSPSKEWLIALRTLQGVFGALLIPGGLAIINTDFPKEERGAAIGLWSAWTASFAAIGPLLGGYLIDVASWRWVFYINVPLIIVCCILTIVDVEEGRDSHKRTVDLPGAVLTALSLAGITYGLIEGPINHWALTSIVPLIAGIIFAGLFLWRESTAKDPMVDLSLFRSRNFSGANLMTFAMYGALGGFIFSLVIYLQTKMGYSSIKAGISLLPVTILMLSLSRRMGALSQKIGPRMFMTVGPLLSAAGMLLLVNYRPGDSYLTVLLPRVILFGAGLVMMVAPLTATVMSSVDDTKSGIASGINNAVSRTAGLVVVALLGLMGKGEVFRFSMLLCAALAASAGIISYLIIQNPKRIPEPAE